MKKSVFLLCLSLYLMPAVSIKAQINPFIVFNYDHNGNRTSMYYIFTRVDENDLPKDTTAFYRNILSDELSPNDISDGYNMNLSIYPNPTTGHLVLASDTDSSNQVIIARLVSAQGKLIEERRLVSNQTEFDLTQEPAGVYFLYIERTGEKQLWKIIKQ